MPRIMRRSAAVRHSWAWRDAFAASARPGAAVGAEGQVELLSAMPHLEWADIIENSLECQVYCRGEPCLRSGMERRLSRLGVFLGLVLPIRRRILRRPRLLQRPTSTPHPARVGPAGHADQPAVP